MIKKKAASRTRLRGTHAGGERLRHRPWRGEMNGAVNTIELLQLQLLQLLQIGGISHNPLL